MTREAKCFGVILVLTVILIFVPYHRPLTLFDAEVVRTYENSGKFHVVSRYSYLGEIRECDNVATKQVTDNTTEPNQKWNVGQKIEIVFVNQYVPNDCVYEGTVVVLNLFSLCCLLLSSFIVIPIVCCSLHNRHRRSMKRRTKIAPTPSPTPHLPHHNTSNPHSSHPITFNPHSPHTTHHPTPHFTHCSFSITGVDSTTQFTELKIHEKDEKDEKDDVTIVILPRLIID